MSLKSNIKLSRFPIHPFSTPTPTAFREQKKGALRTNGFISDIQDFLYKSLLFKYFNNTDNNQNGFLVKETERFYSLGTETKTPIGKLTFLMDQTLQKSI